MIRPLRGYELNEVLRRETEREHPFPILDRAFDAVESTLARLGVENPGSLRTPRPVEDALSATALPDGTLLILSASELRAAELDIEDTVRDERMGGTVFVSLPKLPDLPGRTRGLRELASVARTFGFRHGPSPSMPTRLGRLSTVPTPPALRRYRFLMADTPGFRVCVVARDLPGGGFVALWSGSELVLREVRETLSLVAEDAGFEVPPAASAVPALEGIEVPDDVWHAARNLRDYRVVREAELREIARAAALRGVALRRERDAQRRTEEARRATGT